MKSIALLLLTLHLGLCTTVRADDALPLKAHPDSSSWENLFAPDLSNATFPKDVWFMEDGALTASQDQNIWTRKEYGDFILDLEFKPGEAANSGVVIHCSDLKDWIPNSIEIQILDDAAPKWATAAPTWRCGGLFGRLAPAKSAVKKAGEWNRMTVACKGPMIYVLLNGELVTEADVRKWTDAKKNPDGSDIPSWLNKPMAGLATKGLIGLQGKHGGAPIWFRNVRIKPLD